MLEGYLYLLHFSAAHFHARHYLGWTQGNRRAVERRIEEHLSGKGSPLVKAALDAGLTVEVAALWVGSRAEERELKTRSRLSAHCPNCVFERLLNGMKPARK